MEEINNKKILSVKKQMRRDQIDLSTQIDDLTEKEFALKPLEIGFIQSLALKDDPKFKQIKSIYTKYNEDIVQYNEHSANGLHLKTIVMDSMLKFLRMMFLAPNTETKKTILNIAYFWFIKHLNPKSQRKSRQALQTQIKSILVENRLLPTSIIQKQLPSQKVKEDLYHYRIRARTCYTELEPPALDLENYITHKVSYMNDKGPSVDDDAEKRRKRLLRIHFKKPNLDQYRMPHDTQQEEGKPSTNQINFGSNAVPLPTFPGQQIKPAQIQPQLDAQGQPIPVHPLIPPQNEIQNAANDIANQFGMEPQQPQQAVEEEEDKVKGKLDPFVKLFMLHRQQKEEKIECPQIDQKIRYKNNYLDLVKKEDERMASAMSEWASKRSRFKSEISRKIQSVRAFNTIVGGRTLNEGENKPRLLQMSMNQTSVAETIHDTKRFIRGDIKRQPLNTEAGLSLFDRKRAKTQTQQKHFSDILEQNKRVTKKYDYLDQLDQIRDKFAKKKIYAPLSMIKGAILHPEEKSDVDDTDKFEYPSSLLSNPFFVVKKKKKKGKKKK